MPTVPRITRQVSTAALPGARLTAAETDLSTGVGVEEAKGRAYQQLGRVGQMGQQLGGTMLAIVQQEQEKANAVAVLEQQNALHNATTDILLGDDGVLKKQGKNAMDGPETAMSRFNKATGEIEAKLTNDAQRQAFQKVKYTEQWGLDLQVRRHTAGEMQKYEASELTAFIANGTNTAGRAAFDVQDMTATGGVPRDAFAAVGAQIKSISDKIRLHAPNLGMGPEAVERQVAAATSDVHVEVLDQLIAQDKIKVANLYFDEAKGAINEDQKARLQKSLLAGTARTESQEQFDRITGDYKPDQWKAEARKLTGQLRDDTEARIEHEQAVRETQKREDYRQITINGKNWIDRGGDPMKIPRWAELEVGDAGALKNYADNKTKRIPVVTDQQLYDDLSKQANSLDPNIRKIFQDTNLIGYVDKLSESDYKHFVDAQGAGKQGDAAKMQALVSNDAAQAKMVDEAISAMGFDPTQPVFGQKGYDKFTSDRVIEFRRSVRDSVLRLERNKGKRLDDIEMQAVVDQLRTVAGTRELKKGTLWGAVTTPAFGFEISKPNVTDINAVPRGERQRIIDAMIFKGEPISNEGILRIFNERLQVTRGDIPPPPPMAPPKKAN